MAAARGGGRGGGGGGGEKLNPKTPLGIAGGYDYGPLFRVCGHPYM